MKSQLGLTVALMCLAPAPALALPPDQIFERVAPGIWSVKTYSADDKLMASASGIVVALGKLVTSCQALARARQVQLRRGNSIYEAKLEFPDVERDLCQLDVPGLTAPAVSVGTARGLRTGQRLYVIGYSLGNDQSLGEGLVAAVREAGSAKERIQTTVPAAKGLLGAGVFDEEGRLVGVVTSSPREAAANAFAVPADWVPEIAARGEAALAARAKPAVASGAGPSTADAAPGLPAAGTTWVYGFNQRIFSRGGQVDVTVRVLRVSDTVVEEAITANTSSAKELRRVVDARQSRFVEYPINSSNAVLEPAPYLVTVNDSKIPASIPSPEGYPLGSPGLPGWIVTVQVHGWESITVPAGTFRALRVESAGRRSARVGYRGGAQAGQFKTIAWYAPEVKRLARLEHKVWSADSFSPEIVNDDVLELLAYRPPS
jgi:hypothetical protein